jgi:hypothetical protein
VRRRILRRLTVKATHLASFEKPACGGLLRKS